MIQKAIILSPAYWERIARFRRREGMATETEVLRRLMSIALNFVEKESDGDDA